MKRLLLILCLSLTPVTLACHPPATITTQPGKIAFTADQIVVRVNELQSAAVQANASGALDTANTRTIVEFSVAADKVLKATPSGWQSTVKALWTQARPKITTSNTTVQLAVTALSGILEAL